MSRAGLSRGSFSDASISRIDAKEAFQKSSASVSWLVGI